MTTMFVDLPGASPARGVWGAGVQPLIPAGELTEAEADQYVTELTRRRVQEMVSTCNAQLADWQNKDARVHDLDFYIAAAQTQVEAIPKYPAGSPQYLAAEALRNGLYTQIDEWDAARVAWEQNYVDAITYITQRRDASVAFLNAMPPPPSVLVKYPVPVGPDVGFVEACRIWPELPA